MNNNIFAFCKFSNSFKNTYSAIVFYDPHSANVIRSLIISSQNKLNSTTFSVTPKEGLLVLFPSYLHHSVDMNKSDNERIVISFNLNLFQK